MKTAFESIRKGLEEAVEYAQENKNNASVHCASEPDVKAIRQKIGMNKSDFASTLGISMKTLRYWEKGERKPKGPGLVLLNIMNKAPEAVIDILSH